jgi:hypothetical protein
MPLPRCGHCGRETALGRTARIDAATRPICGVCLGVTEPDVRGLEPVAGPAKDKKRPKYRNAPVVVDGERFDSKKEAEHIRVLKEMERRGEIRDLKYAKKDCRINIVVNGVRVCAAIPDAIYTHTATGAVVYVDVKSEITRRNPVYRLKKKLLRAVHGIEVEER